MTKKTKADAPVLPPVESPAVIGRDPLIMLAELAVKLEAMPAGEEKERFLNELAKSIPRDAREEMEQRALAVVAGEESVRGFEAFYRLIHGMEMPRHNKRQVEGMFKAHEDGVGWLGFSWTGSWKTTTLNATFNAWMLGLHPKGTELIVGANDDSAEKVTKAISTMIEFHPNWGRVFPTVKPDTDKGWSVEGYWVRDESVDRAEWSKHQAAIIDPSFVGGGWSSSRINGKHPSLVMTVDDIHDRENSASSRTRIAVVDTFLKVIDKRPIREQDRLKTWVHLVGTPWDSDDVYHTAKNSGQYDFMAVPAMTRATPEAEGAVYIDGVNKRNGVVYEDIIGWWYLEWPERYGVDSIISDRSKGKASFWQMIMLDLAQAKTAGLKYYLYDHTKIDPAWLHGGGCDFATLQGTVPDPGRDSFSISIGAKTPLNQIVVTGGIIEQVSQAKADDYLETIPTHYQNFRYITFEGDGAGEQYYLSFVRQHPGAKVVMKKTGGKAKRYRQEREMGPWLENGIILISDADSKYLVALRKALDDSPDGDNDIRDGLYWLAHTFAECLVVPKKETSLPKVGQRERVSGHPLAGIRDFVGYGH